MHERIVSQLADYRHGRLSEDREAQVRRHLGSCASCREVANRWVEAPVPAGFARRVMAGLGTAEPPREADLWRWAIPALGAAAMVMVLAAFWHPERSWVEADKSFAFTDRVTAGAKDYHPAFREDRSE